MYLYLYLYIWRQYKNEKKYDVEKSRKPKHFSFVANSTKEAHDLKTHINKMKCIYLIGYSPLYHLWFSTKWKAWLSVVCVCVCCVLCALYIHIERCLTLYNLIDERWKIKLNFWKKKMKRKASTFNNFQQNKINASAKFKYLIIQRSAANSVYHFSIEIHDF